MPVMHKSLVILGLLGSAFAVPRPQIIELDEIKDSPPASTSAGAKRSILNERSCEALPKGYGPVANPDTVEGFFALQELKNVSANAVTPDSYAQAFKGLNGSLTAPNYMGLYTLTAYDTLGCAAKCDQTSGCVAFNMYAERDPTIDANDKKCITGGPSTTTYECTLWGTPVSPEEAINYGQYRGEFKVVITASNAYNKIPDPISSFDGPTALPGAINAPTSSGSYMGYKYFAFSQTQGYTPETCAKVCTDTTAYNAAHPDKSGGWQSCVQFNAYILSKNGSPLGLYCSMYNQTWGSEYAVNYGQYRGKNKYTVSMSYSYTLRD